jgi:hypothetical protein
LAVVWLGNAAITVWLREAASADTLRGLLSLGLVLYATWHVAKAAFFRPESPFEWTPAEREALAMLPLAPRDLVAYQLASITVTTSLKTGLFALLLLPDLRCLPLALIGLLLAMMMLELLRMAVDITTWGMSRMTFLVYRIVVVAGLVAGGFTVGGVLVHNRLDGSQIKLGEGLLSRFLEILLQLNGSVIGYAAVPFQPVIELIVAERVTASMAGLAAVGVAAVTLFAAEIVGLYSMTVRLAAERERIVYCPRSVHYDRRNNNHVGDSDADHRAHRRRRLFPQSFPRWGGAGPLVWRQLLGAGRSWGSLLTAMIAPAVLACAPCFVIADANIALLATAATLVFYTFLLLPTALRYDFRRDLDRMAMLKGLPITPAATVVGQTIVPVLIATAFQTAVLAFAVTVRSLPPHYLVSTMLVVLPLNALVFSFENLVFLLYPYRVQQEGLEIFVRTMLTFTGKGLLFALGLGAMSMWGFAAAALARGIARWTGIAADPFAVFAAGMIAGPAVLAANVLGALCRTYQRLDPIEDIPR